MKQDKILTYLKNQIAKEKQHLKKLDADSLEAKTSKRVLARLEAIYKNAKVIATNPSKPKS